MPIIADSTAAAEALTLAGIVAGYAAGRLTAGRRQARTDIAEIEATNAARPPRTVFQLLAWTLTTTGRTMRLLAVLTALPLALPSSTAQALASAVLDALAAR